MTQSKTNKAGISTLQLAELGILLALVIVLQSFSSFGFVALCLCLVPITLGAIVLDWKCSSILGFAFGVVTIFWGVIGKDAFTLFLFQENPVMTILICLLKGTLCGMVPAFIYTALKKYNKLGGVFAASMAAPIVNTGIFALGCIIIQGDVMAASDRLLNDTLNMGIDLEAMGFMSVLFGVLITANFFIEFAINVVLAPSLNRVTEVVTKRIQSGSKKKA